MKDKDDGPVLPEGCDLCGDQGSLALRAKCHMTAPLAVERNGNELIIRCYITECNREVARFTIADAQAQPAPESSGTVCKCGHTVDLHCGKEKRISGTCMGEECQCGWYTPAPVPLDHDQLVEIIKALLPHAMVILNENHPAIKLARRVVP